MYPRKEGKRGYRRKVARTGDEFIQVPLPLEPVISKEQHQRILDIIENLRKPRAQSKAVATPRFTYRGYLRCGSCGSLIYTCNSGAMYLTGPKDFYYCKARSTRERQKRLTSGGSLTCENRYMSRKRLEELIDAAIASQLTELSFLTRVIQSHVEAARRGSPGGQDKRLKQRLASLEAKRVRIIDSYIDGTIGRSDKQSRLSDVDFQIAEVNRQLAQYRPFVFDPGQILRITQVFREWEFLGMKAKRRLMEQLLPQIYVDRYEIKGVRISVGAGSDSANVLPKAAA
jgi:hypothetical protein